MDFVMVEMGQWDYPECRDPLMGVFLAPIRPLWLFYLGSKSSMTRARRMNAGRIAKYSIGKALGAIPLCVLGMAQID